MKHTTWLLIVSVAALAVTTFAAAPPKKTGEIGDNVKDADGLAEALRNLKAKMVGSPPLAPKEALKSFTVRDGLAVDLIAHEPAIRQPLYLTFDERGRMWVVQYRQYPFPSGLKVVAYDRYIRAKFDKVPPPPPNHFKGEDRITILEDVKGDGSFSKVTTFLDDLNIATAALPGRGGVWVLNPPYLLFYPDPKRTDKAGTPIVHLSGFGLEDTHSVASSLCWGPDGWIYGAHGSTVTAKVKVEVEKETKTTDFMGQAIWRYHPERHVFEIFAEGGGNTFGVAFDDVGRVYSGTNWGKYRGLHYVQGGYYIKGWGKHGPLTNPYALGYFDHMPHTGNADRLVHQFIVYDDTTIPGLKGKIVGVNSLQNRLHVTKFEKVGSTFRTVEEEPFLITSKDQRFRPVDVKQGPDGALYIADLYEPRINHVDPRDNWDKATGRIYRVRPKDYKSALPRDLSKKTSKELIDLFETGTRGERDTALRLLGDRKDRSVIPALKKHLAGDDAGASLYSLWALHQVGGLDDETLLAALTDKKPALRRWAVRLIGDDPSRKIEGKLRAALLRVADDDDPEVRSQAASTAKRLPAELTLPMVQKLWSRSDNNRDPHLPLLIWWALESKAESDQAAIVRTLSDLNALKPLFAPENDLLEKLAQRWMMAGGRDNYDACAKLLDQKPARGFARRYYEKLLRGVEKGLEGRAADDLPKPLSSSIVQAHREIGKPFPVTLGLRLRRAASVAEALKLIANAKTPAAQRIDCIRVLGEINEPTCVPVLLKALEDAKDDAIRREILQALPRYDDGRIPAAVLARVTAKRIEPDSSRLASLNLLAARPAWSLLLLKAIDEKNLDSRSIPVGVVQRIQLHSDKEIVKLLGKHYGRVRANSPAEKGRELLRIGNILKAGKGDVLAGKKVFADTCAKCHKLFGEGGDVGPDLTGYERSNALYWMENVVDPSAIIREEYMTFVIRTDDGRTLTGVIAGRDKTTITLRDQDGKTSKIARAKIEDESASTTSLMPEGQMKALKDQQIRDLFAYLISKAGVK